MSRKLLAALTALALVPAGAAAQETFQIKVKDPEKGDSALYRKLGKVRTDVKVVDGNGNALENKKEEKADQLAYRQTILEKPAGAKRGTKLKREYSQAVRVEDDNKETLPYQGKTVLIEKKGARYVFQIAGGGELTGKAANELDEEFNKGKVQNLGHDWVLPKKAVRVGESWKIDVSPLVQEMESSAELKLNGAKAEGTGTLTKAYKKDGRQFGVLDLRITVPVEALGAGGMSAKAKDSKINFRMTLDGCIDGSSFDYRLTGVIQGDINAGLDVNGMTLNITVRVNANMDEARKDAGNQR